MGVSAPLGISASGRSPYWPADRANGVVQGLLTALGAGKPFSIYGPMNLVIWADIIATLTTTNGSDAFSVNSATGLAVGNAINGVNVPRGTTLKTLTGTAGTLGLPTYTLWGKTNTTEAKIFDLPLTDGLLGSAVAGPGIPAGTTVAEILVSAIAPGSAPSASEGRRGIVRITNVPTLANNLDIGSPFEFALTNQAVATGADAAASFTGNAISYTASVQLERSFDGGKTWIVCNVGGSGALAIYSNGTPISLSFGEPEREVLYRLNVTTYSAGRINYRLSTTGQVATTLSVPSVI